MFRSAFYYPDLPTGESEQQRLDDFLWVIGRIKEAKFFSQDEQGIYTRHLKFGTSFKSFYGQELY